MWLPVQPLVTKVGPIGSPDNVNTTQALSCAGWGDQEGSNSRHRTWRASTPSITSQETQFSSLLRVRRDPESKGRGVSHLCVGLVLTLDQGQQEPSCQDETARPCGHQAIRKQTMETNNNKDASCLQFLSQALSSPGQHDLSL